MFLWLVWSIKARTVIRHALLIPSIRMRHKGGCAHGGGHNERHTALRGAGG